MKSLGTALRVLLEFTGDRLDLGVGEVAARLGLQKAQVSKTLRTFREHGLLVQDPVTRRYSVGLRAYALGTRFISHDRLSREALPVLRGLSGQTGHSARISVADNDDVMYLMTVKGPHLVDTGWRIGQFMPLHATTAGKVALAFFDPVRTERILAGLTLEALTPNTITSHKRLRAELAAIRRNGFGISRGETVIGLGTIGVPVFGAGEKPIAVLGLAFPEHVVQAGERNDLVRALHRSARILSQRMGSQVYPFSLPEKPTRAARAAAE